MKRKKLTINRKKLWHLSKYVMVLILVVVAVTIFPSTLSKYSSHGGSNAKVDVAFSLLDTKGLSDTVVLDEILPNDDYDSYSFSVSNYDEEGNRIDVNLNYTITIRTTTNLPIVYEIYDDKGVKLDVKSEIIEDEFGTPFLTMVTDKSIMTFDKDMIKKYTIKYKLSSEYKDASYQNIIEMISISIDAEQIV